MNNGKDVPLGTERRRLGRIGRLGYAARVGLRKGSDWLAGFPATPRTWGEPLEARQLLSTTAFSVSIAAPPTVTANQQFYVYVWTADGTVSGDYAVDPGGGESTQYVAPSTTSPVTPIPIDYAYGTTGSHTITVTATDTLDVTACQTCGMDDLGNYPATYGGPTTFVPSGAGTATPSSIVVDPGTGDTYVAETYHTSGSGCQMALTRLDANDLPDTTWGTYVSGSTYTGTLVVPAFGGGSTGTDVAYGAAVEDADITGIGSVDEVAIAGHSTNGMAAAIIDVAGTGSVLGTSGYGSQTMPAACAFAVTFDDSGDVVLAGTDTNQYNMVAVALYGTAVGTTKHVGQLDTSFGPSGTGVTTFGFGGTTCTVARAIMQEPEADGGNEELVLGGWCSAGCGACSTQCNLIVVGLTDGYGAVDRGDLDTDDFGLPDAGTGLHTGYNDVNVGDTACLAGWNGCYGCVGCGVPSNDSIYSLVWDDEITGYDVVAVGTTNYSPSYQPVLWGLTQTGQADTSSGADSKGFGDLGTNGDGLAVPNIDIYSSTVVAGAVATESSPADGDIYIAGTFHGYSSDLLLARYTVPGSPDSGGVYGLDPNFGTSLGGTGDGTGYFQQDLGSATADSSDYGVGVAEGIDGSVVLLGSTDSAGGSTAVIRYNATSAIDVLEGEPSRRMSLAAVQAAATSATPFSAAPAITSDATANDLSPPDGALDPGTTRKRLSARRPAALAASPPPLVSSAPG